ncbi:SDR family oxidoreductase [Ralstonia insidiosa]|jgi:NAD(P)-dependent dehydrogenase (short-subunit alcohol dehydrogenase family)|uniref:SDR family oxidoreductase n=1 Tax=Ralstonia TaxID=48736 RepID=UPI000664BE76|nr:SDR family oxidoreductase [Ralstonia insidiosa]KMW48186.1 dehydrogenase [Ralstonia sp. MD27]MBX3770206.1 SDR family oxidoreductase [Ralstonia pickettii]NOZ98648.1 SDR family oxidoreductase [Betaproteobacteria bacterium]MBA9854367.1 SDR family oxidoreductase [Ralstonia insidiosa]MBA9868182.1 SDR family oxidoreductase [Ralstonia insidiosa]
MTSTTLQDQAVVVLGGTAGIGQAVARAAAAAGARVTVLGRSAKTDGGIHGIAVDANDTASLGSALVQAAAGGKIDHLVITIGSRTSPPPFASLQRADLEQGFGTKLFAALMAVQAALPYLAERASITLTSGLLSRKPTASGLLRASINAAVEAAAKNLAKELAPRRVNVVSPGVVDTEVWGAPADREAMLARIGAGLPVGRVGTPDDLAQGYLLAMTNGFMTGAIIDIEGGGLL